jgi:hypothetical protein
MTAEIIDLAGHRPGKASGENAADRVKRVLTDAVMGETLASVLGRPARAMVPATRAEHVAALAIGAADLAREGHFLRAAALLQLAAELAFAEAGIKPVKRGRRQPTTKR